MKLARAGLSLLVAVVSFVSVGQEPDSGDPPARDDSAQTPPEAPPEAEDSRTLEEIFIPSEEIAADEEVTFPINI